MDSKTVKLNCLTLGEWSNEPISQKKWSIPLKSDFCKTFALNFKRRNFADFVYAQTATLHTHYSWKSEIILKDSIKNVCIRQILRQKHRNVVL